MPHPDDRASEIAPGTEIGGYVVRVRLSTGGFGTIYRVEHTVDGRPAALKVLHPELSSSDEVVERLRREARAVNVISHPNVVDIYDVRSLPDGRHYLLMELLEGRDLEALLRDEHHLTPAQTLEILEPLCDGLSAAHAEGIIHRDLKASNVFLDERGPTRRVVLLDFGIAKLLDPGTTDLTTSHHSVGSPASMAPEQIVGGAVDARTDVYGLGSLTFHMLTGGLPFADSSATVMQHMHLHARRPRVSRQANVTTAFDAVLARAMDKDPARRFADVRGFLDAFRDLVQPGPSAPARVREDRRRAVAVHVDIRIAPEELDDPDDATLADIDAVQTLTRTRLRDRGFRTGMESGLSSLYVMELGAEDETATRRAGVETARRLYHDLQSRTTRDPRVHVNVSLAVGEVVLTDGRVRGGELLRPGAWLPDRDRDGVVGTPEVFEDLGLDTEPAGDGLLRIVATRRG